MTVAANIIPVNIEDEIRNSYMDYAMSVIIGRALPDVRDGLKPVHRRILFSMHELGNRWNASYKKSARVVGDVIGKYHPHGDSAVYDALVRLAQDFNMRVPLVDGQGNFGSVDGDPAAAMRYTEVRMSRAAGELLADIDRDTVDFGPNYDDSELEPLVLPTKLPNLLVNGAEGIAVGMATKIPPHNLGEVLNGVIAQIHNPAITIDELMQHIPGPDFPTGAYVCGRAGIDEAYRTGRGRIVMRAVIEVEEFKAHRSALVITELPFQVNKARLVEKLAELVRDKKIDDISDLRDESDRRGMRVVIELKTGAVPEVVINQLHKMTPTQQTFGVIMLAIVAGQPQVMSLKEVINHFIDFRRDVVTRRTIFLLRKAREREHILEGLKIALDHIDAVIALIRASSTVADARQGLMTEFGLSEVQAQAILDMRLQKLTGLERDKILEELAEVRRTIEGLLLILSSDQRLHEVIVEELEEMRTLFSGKEHNRRTKFTTAAEGLDDPLSLIAEEDVAITLSGLDYIKKTPLTDYRSQNRGGKGKRGMATRDADYVKDVVVVSTHDQLLVFTSAGRVFRLPVHEVPTVGPAGRGRPIVNLLRMEPDEKVASVVPIRDFEEGRDLVFATKLGVIKRTELGQYSNVNVSGLRAVNLREGDDLIAVRLVEPGQEVLLATKVGQSIRFELDGQVRPMGRAASGVRGIDLREGDAVIGMEVLRGDGAPILTVCEKGYGKRTETDEYRLQHRGGLGIISIKTTDRNGPVVAVKQVDENDEILMISNKGQLIRLAVKKIRQIGRNTQGVKLFSLGEDEVIVGVARVPEDERDEENTDELPSDSAEELLVEEEEEVEETEPATDGPDEVLE